MYTILRVMAGCMLAAVKMHIILAVMVLTSGVIFAETEVVDGVTWHYEIKDGVATVTAGTTPCTGNLSVPVTLGGCPVERIGVSAFENRGVETIELHEGIKSIGSYAFSSCKHLNSIVLPDTITNVGDHAFQLCTVLTNAVWSSGCSRVSNGTFMGCIKLRSVTIPSGTVEIGDRAFECTSLEDAILPSGVTNVNDYAFSECGRLERVELPTGLENIGEFAFYRCTNLTCVLIPSSVERIGGAAFRECLSLNRVSISSGVRAIGSSAFYECRKLEKIDIPSTVEEVGVTPFCVTTTVRFDGAPPRNLTSAELSENMRICYHSDCSQAWETVISTCGFRNARACLRDGGPYKETVEGVSWSFRVNDWEACVGNLGWQSDDPGTSIRHVAIVTISMSTEGVVSIPAYLGGCLVTGIGNWAFSGCARLTGLEMPGCIVAIGARAFSGCSGLTSLTIPEGTTKIKGGAFCICTNLTTVAVNKYNQSFTIVDGVLYDVTLSELIWCPPNKSGVFAIPAGVTNIESYAFADCTGLTGISIPDSVVQIGSYAFARCAGLTDISIPQSVATVGSCAFSGCKGLKSLSFDGSAPICDTSVLDDTPTSLVVHADKTSTGWTQWNGRSILFDNGMTGMRQVTGSCSNVVLTVTNVVVHYVLNSIVPEIAVPVSDSTGFVNVITAVTGGNGVAISQEWQANYPHFAELFGTDFAQALMSKTGKVDGMGKPMFVWQDYVAGTDPTDPDSVFSASVSMVEGKPVISWSPELNADEAAKRVYKVFGKERLQDANWTEIARGRESDYNFFKVTVEMK